uniref:Uncharacterized protein n=1 Tax=Branchiostoma floridae TaxID=7739 RepID=C3XXL6_BRAFL|eukprot:XP_002611466.1 hypothetical protein BRAFLDRAFT_63900 [Branchiostoma floridae]
MEWVDIDMVGHNLRVLWREFPIKQVTVLSVLLASGSIAGSSRHPFLPFLTHDFFPYLKSNQIVGCIFLGESLDRKPKADYISLTQMSNHDEGEEDKEKPHRQQESTCRLLKDRLVLLPCALYALFALVHICCDQLLPLLLVSDSQHGGYNFDAAEISIVLTVGHIYSTAAQATLNPFLASKFSYKTVYMWGVALYAVGIVMLPSMVDITGAIITSQQPQKGANQTVNFIGVTLNFTADSEYLLASPPVTESHIQPTVRSRQPHEVANLTGSDFTLTSKADSAYLSTSAPVTESHIHPTSQRSPTSPLYFVVTTELNTTVARPLIITGQCRLGGDRRRTSQHPASEVPARVWGPLLSVIVMMEQGKTLTYLAAIVMVGNAGVVSNIPPTVAFPQV